MSEEPNPGSKAALAKGCSCPILDNNYGAGIDMGGDICFYIAASCIIHGDKKEKGGEGEV